MSSVALKNVASAPVETHEPGRRWKFILYTVLILAALVAALWAYTSYTAWSADRTRRTYITDVENLFVALQQYKEKIGAYPTGNNGDIARALSGKNPKSVIVVVSNRIPLNEKGEFVDPWGTPVMVYFAGNSVLVRSAGPNRKWEDARNELADDIVLSN
jgi:hypothetical protein